MSYEIDCADVLETLGWETLESRRQRMKSVFLYKILNDYTARDLKHSLVGSYPMPASYMLRSTGTDIALPKPRRKFLKKTFKYSVAKLWNSLLEKQKKRSQFPFLNKIVSGSTYKVTPPLFCI